MSRSPLSRWLWSANTSATYKPTPTTVPSPMLSNSSGFSPILEENRLRFPVLQDIVNKHSLPSSTTVFAKTQMLQTDRGDHFMAFAKHRKFAKGGRRNSWYTSKESDIWLSLVADELRSPLAVQGWLNGASGDLKTDCSTPYNVRY